MTSLISHSIYQKLITSLSHPVGLNKFPSLISTSSPTNLKNNLSFDFPLFN